MNLKHYLALGIVSLASVGAYGIGIADWDFREGQVDSIKKQEATVGGVVKNIEFSKNGVVFNNQKATNNDGGYLVVADYPALTGHDNNKKGLSSINLKVSFVPEIAKLAVLVRKTDVGTDFGYQLFMNKVGKVGLRIKNQDGKTINVISKNTIKIGEENTVEATADTARDPYNLQIKLNGVVTRASAEFTPLSDTQSPLIIGALMRKKNGSGQYFVGKISQVEISDITRSLDEPGEIDLSVVKMSGEHLTKQAGFEQMSFVYDIPLTPECHGASIIDLGNDELLATWFGGTCEGHIDVGIWTARFRNGKWEKPVEAAQRLIINGVYYPLWNPLLFKHSSGKVFLFYKYGLISKGLHSVFMTSDDNGITWNEPVLPGKNLHGPSKNKPIELEDGTIYCPAGGKHMEYTQDLGKTWSIVKMPASSLKGVIQPTIIQHGKGKLQAIYRTMGETKIAENYSLDNGKTWDEIKTIDLPSNNSGFDAVTLNDGKFALVYNHAETPKGRWGGKRTPLNIAVSDDGKKWSAALVLEDEPGEFSYPSIIQSKDGKIHVIYTWNRVRIKHVVLDPDKFKSQPIVNSVWPKL